MPVRFFAELVRKFDDGLFGIKGDRNNFFTDVVVVVLTAVSAGFCFTGVRAFCNRIKKCG